MSKTSNLSIPNNLKCSFTVELVAVEVALVALFYPKNSFDHYDQDYLWKNVIT